MAWSFVQHHNVARTTTAGTTIGVQPAATIPANAVAVLRVATDNAGTAASSSTLTVEDSKGNSWQRAIEHTRGGGGAGLGVTAAIFFSKLTFALLATDTVTLTVSSSVDAKAVALDEYAVATSTAINALPGVGANGNSLAPSVALSGATLGSKAYQFIAVVGIEGASADTFTQPGGATPAWTGIPFAATTTGATDTDNVVARSGRAAYITTGASVTYAPTIGAGVARDWAATIIALEELASGAPLAVPHLGASDVYSDTYGSRSIVYTPGVSAGGGGSGFTMTMPVIGPVSTVYAPTLLGDAIEALDVQVKLSINTGPGDSASQSNVNDSIGGFMASTAVTSAVAHNLFDPVSAADNSALDVEYRCLFFHNASPTLSWTNVRVWLESEVAGGANAHIALDPGGIKNAGSATAQAVRVANENTAPTNGGNPLTWGNPTSSGAGLVPATVGPDQCFAVWVRRTPTNSASMSNDGVVLRAEGEIFR